MKELHQRALLYGVAAIVLGGLGVAVATNRTDADAMTLLSSADVQLRLAYGIPENDRKGHALSSRGDMINEAIGLLERVEREKPGMAITAEFRGFAHMLRGEYADAAVSYARARRCKDCADEQGDVLAFNQARMLAMAGQNERALAVFAEHGKALDSRFGQQRAMAEAAILRQLGRREEAVAKMRQVLQNSAAEPMAWLQAGLELEQLDELGSAATAFAAAAEGAPIADYHLARLKLRSGETDIALACLERALVAVPAEVRRMVQNEPEVWQGLSNNARFEQLTGPSAATPGR